MLGGGFYATAPVAASAPGTPGSVWPHYTYGSNEYGWVVRDAIDGVGNNITIYVICADEPAGYGVVTSNLLNYSDGGWAGWSVPAGKVVLGGGFVLSDPFSTSAGAAAVSVPGTPDSVWPHYTYGADEYGWCVRDAPDGAPSYGSYVYAIYAESANTAVGLTAQTYNITAINVEPGSIAFGRVNPGDVVSGPNITVENIGGVTVNVDAYLDPLNGTVFNYLKLGGAYSPAYCGDWADYIISGLKPSLNQTLTTVLDVPSTYSGKGPEAATLIFEATAV